LHGLGKFEKIALLYGINGWEISRSLPRGIFPIQEATADAINEHRLVLGLAQGAKLSKGWLISNGCLAPLLRYNVLLLRFYETHGFKLFNVVPMCKIKRHFIDIDTFGLFGILKEVGIVNCNEAVFETLRDEHWLATFRIPKLQGANCTFSHSIETDGVVYVSTFNDPERRTGRRKSTHLPRTTS
jgi:hypothetical protein